MKNGWVFFGRAAARKIRKKGVIKMYAILCKIIALFMAALQSLLWFAPGLFGGDLPVDTAAYTPPVYGQVGDESQAAEHGGWYLTYEDNFDGDALNSDLWVTSPHGLRNTEYWCDNMVRVENGNCVISAAYLDDNDCPDGKCPASGDFTSGIETRGKQEQVFGYYEARVKFPKAEGLWSAMWFQSGTMGRLGNGGKDGSEIDVFESSFYHNPTQIGHCIHWDGYSDTWHRDSGAVVDTGVDLYDDYHVWGLLWTPTEYTFFLDGKPIACTNAGGVSQVAEYLRFTVEIRHTEYGPYGQKLGEFINTRENPAEFQIDYVRAYQNTDFIASQKRRRISNNRYSQSWCRNKVRFPGVLFHRLLAEKFARRRLRATVQISQYIT